MMAVRALESEQDPKRMSKLHEPQSTARPEEQRSQDFGPQPSQYFEQHPSQYFGPPHSGPQPPQLGPQPPQFGPPQPKQHNVLAIIAMVVASLALVMGLGGFVAPLLFAMIFGGFSLADEPLGTEGTAPQVVAGQSYPGTLLQDEVTRVIGSSIGDVTSITCPATPVVATKVVTVCDGIVDGTDWSFKVTFEDGLGHFTLDEKAD
jgi:hypothetical protein